MRRHLAHWRRSPPLPGDLHDVPGRRIEHLGVQQQLVDLGGGCGIQLTEDDRGVAEYLGELGCGIGAYRAYLDQGQRRDVERDVQGASGGEPRHRRELPADQRGQRRGIENLAADHAASGATGCSRRTSSSPGHAAPAWA